MRKLLVLLALGILALGLFAPAGAAGGKVRIVITVSNCEGCHILAGRADEWNWASLGARVVRHGRVVFRVPQAKTLGMRFTVEDAHAAFTDAQPVAIIRYADQAAGERIGRARAVREGYGYVCTGAVSGASAQWHLRVAHVPVRGGYDLRPYFTPGVASLGTPERLRRGGLGINGDFFCTPPSPPASLSTFVRDWIGHTRDLVVTPSGVATEDISDGCCTPVVKATYRVDSVSGTAADATAAVTVTAVTPGTETMSTMPVVGQRGTLHLTGGLLTSSLTGGTLYCDLRAARSFACGA